MNLRIKLAFASLWFFLPVVAFLHSQGWDDPTRWLVLPIATGGLIAGIRLAGKRRAFVWGNQGLRIQTTTGEIFLGYRDPERMIHDLDAIKQLAH